MNSSITSNKEQFYLNVIYVLISLIVVYTIVFIILVAFVVRKWRKKNSYSNFDAISKTVKQSPLPSPPNVIRKSKQRARVFSGSKSKSRSRSCNRNNKNELFNSCHINATDKDYVNLNANNQNTACSNDILGNLSHNGVILDLEDCCQMTLCDTVRHIALSSHIKYKTAPSILKYWHD